MSGIRILACIVLCNLFLSVNVPLCFADAVDMANNGMKAYKAGDKKKAKILLKSALKSNELSKENYIIVNNQLCDVLQSELENKKAVDCYSESLYLDPDNPEALIGRGMLYYDMGLTQRALEDLTLYTQVSPKDPNGFIKKGLAYRELSNYDQAISDLSHAVWLRPQNADVYIHRGKTYVKARNYNLALADFEKAMKFAPENPYTYEAMAWFYA
ncbi:MAG: tetratricopeptide repeat protein, partial [Desulfobacterales bacterium]|nr:tetratricopeptide repeat protein [Desulfobacterales bacterium]